MRDRERPATNEEIREIVDLIAQLPSELQSLAVFEVLALARGYTQAFGQPFDAMKAVN